MISEQYIDETDRLMDLSNMIHIPRFWVKNDKGDYVRHERNFAKKDKDNPEKTIYVRRFFPCFPTFLRAPSEKSREKNKSGWSAATVACGKPNQTEEKRHNARVAFIRRTFNIEAPDFRLAIGFANWLDSYRNKGDHETPFVRWGGFEYDFQASSPIPTNELVKKINWQAVKEIKEKYNITTHFMHSGNRGFHVHVFFSEDAKITKNHFKYLLTNVFQNLVLEGKMDKDNILTRQNLRWTGSIHQKTNIRSHYFTQDIQPTFDQVTPSFVVEQLSQIEPETPSEAFYRDFSLWMEEHSVKTIETASELPEPSFSHNLPNKTLSEEEETCIIEDFKTASNILIPEGDFTNYILNGTVGKLLREYGFDAVKQWACAGISDSMVIHDRCRRLRSLVAPSGGVQVDPLTLIDAKNLKPQYLEVLEDFIKTCPKQANAKNQYFLKGIIFILNKMQLFESTPDSIFLGVNQMARVIGCSVMTANNILDFFMEKDREGKHSRVCYQLGTLVSYGVMREKPATYKKDIQGFKKPHVPAYKNKKSSDTKWITWTDPETKKTYRKKCETLPNVNQALRAKLNLPIAYLDEDMGEVFYVNPICKKIKEHTSPSSEDNTPFTKVQKAKTQEQQRSFPTNINQESTNTNQESTNTKPESTNTNTNQESTNTKPESTNTNTNQESTNTNSESTNMSILPESLIQTHQELWDFFQKNEHIFRGFAKDNVKRRRTIKLLDLAVNNNKETMKSTNKELFDLYQDAIRTLSTKSMSKEEIVTYLDCLETKITEANKFNSGSVIYTPVTHLGEIRRDFIDSGSSDDYYFADDDDELCA